MSIVDRKPNDVTLVDFVAARDEFVPAASRPPDAQSSPVAAHDDASGPVARFIAALRQGGTTDPNRFMLHDRAVYQEFRVSAERQAMKR